MNKPTQKHPFFFSPLPCYSYYDSENRAHVRDHWIDLWNMPAPAVNYYLFILSKLDNSGTGQTVPVTDKEIVENSGAAARTVRESRLACEQCRLIERVLDADLPRGTYVFRLPPTIMTQGQIPQQQSNMTSNPPQDAKHDVKSASTSGGNTVNPPVSGGNDVNPPDAQTAPEATPPQASEAVARDLRFFLDLDLDIIESIVDIIISNGETKSGRIAGRTKHIKIREDTLDKLQKLCESMPEFDKTDVLRMAQQFAKDRDIYSPFIFVRTGNNMVPDQIKDELTDRKEGRAIVKRGDVARKTKRDVPDAVVTKWIEWNINQQTFDGFERVDGKVTTKLRDKTFDEKQEECEKQRRLHESGQLNYQAIADWQENGGGQSVDMTPMPRRKDNDVQSQHTELSLTPKSNNGTTADMKDLVEGVLDELG